MDKDNLSQDSNETLNSNKVSDATSSATKASVSNTDANTKPHEPISSKRLNGLNNSHSGSASSTNSAPKLHKSKHSKSGKSIFKNLPKQIASYFNKHRISTTLIFLAIVVIIILDIWFFVLKPKNQLSSNNNSQVVKEYNEKLPELKKAIEKNPKDAVARRNYAVALYVTSDYEAAKNQYEEATKIDNKDATTYNNLGNTYRDLKNYNKAVEAYNKAIELNPKYTNAYVNLANVQLYSQKKTDDAIATYKKALKAMPNDNQIELLLGIAYENAGKTTEAKQTYQNILSRSPDDKAAKSNLDRLNK